MVTGVWVGFFVICAIIAIVDTQQARAALAEAHQQWESGRKSEAVATYKYLIEKKLTSLPKADKPVVFARLVEFEAEKGDTGTARLFIEQAEKESLALLLSSPKAKDVMAQIQKERDDKLAADRAKREKAEQERKARQEQAEIPRRKLAAFKEVIDKLKKAPGDLASSEERHRFNSELSDLVHAFKKLPLDIKSSKDNRDTAVRIVELYRKEIDRKFKGQIINELEEEIANMVLTLTD